MNKTMKTFWNYLENNLYFQCKDASLSAPFVFMTDKYMRVAMNNAFHFIKINF